MKTLTCLATFLFLSIFYLTAHAQEPVLTIEDTGKTENYTRQELLKHAHLQKITMENSRAYLGTKLSLFVVPICELLKSFKVEPSDTLELIATDRFSSLAPAKFFLNCKAQDAVAYVAIEPEDKPWPPLRYNNPDKNANHNVSAGPYMIVFTHPERAYVSNEYWAWQLAKIKIHHQLSSNLVIPPPETTNSRILNGYQAYVSRCLGCHTMNNYGKAQIGPDLNVPKNPTEYFKDDALLKQFIRDPQSVRRLSNDRMSGTSEEFLSNQDLDDLVLYLRYMANHKIKK